MLKFRTEIEPMLSVQPIGCTDSILILGSCFADYVGNWLKSHHLNVCVNPFGTLYNPSSIAHNLTNLLSRKRYDPVLDVQNGTLVHASSNSRLYYSLDHHSKFYAVSPEQLSLFLNDLAEKTEQFLEETDHLLVTLGTSYVYSSVENHCVVANCHKLPMSCFSRRMLSVEEIVSEWSTLIDRLPTAHILFSVSPIRHIKDTLHGNQLSKATLLLAIDVLCKKYPRRVEYLPIYELFMDDLRDYRYYASDLLHPSDFAIKIVIDYFSRFCITSECQLLIQQVSSFLKILNHRPFEPKSEEYRAILSQNIIKIEQLIGKNAIFTQQSLKSAFLKRLEECGFE